MPQSRKRAKARPRRRTWIILGGLAVVLVLLVVPLLLSARHAQAANADLTRAMSALKRGDVGAARTSVAEARKNIDDAQGGLAGVSTHVLGAVPVLGTPVDDVAHLTRALDDVTSVAETGIRLYPEVAGPNATLFRNQQLDKGTLQDVVAGVRDAGPHLLSAQSELAEVHGSFPLVGGTISAKRDAAQAKVDPMADGYTRAQPMLPELPRLFGFEGTQRYLVAMLNPAELRYSGGAPLAFAPMIWDQGHLSMGEAFSLAEDARFGHDTTWHRVPGNKFHPALGRLSSATFAPSWSVSGEELLRGWNRYTGAQDDGVLAIDVVAMAKLLAVTGPTTVPGLGQVSAGNVVRLLAGNYDAFYPDASAAERTSASTIVGSLQGALFNGGKYAAKGRALKAAADERHLALYFRDTALEEGASALGLDGDLGSSAGDYLGVFTQPTVGTKVDYYQRRTVSLDVTLGRDGRASDRLGVTLDNDTPPFVAAPLPDPRYGYFTRWSTMAATTFLPGDAELDSSTLGGKPGPDSTRQFYDHSFFTQRTVIPPASTQRLEAAYDVPGAATVSDSGSMTYRLSVDPQGTVHPTSATVTVHLPSGYEATTVPSGWTVGADTLTFKTDSLQSEDWEITLEPTG